MSRCLLCRGKAKLKERERPCNVYCSPPCQYIRYRLYEDATIGPEVIRDIQQKIIRDVNIRELWRICTTNRMMAGICNQSEFRQRYYEAHKTEVDAFISEKLASMDGNPDLQSWIAMIVAGNPDYQRTDVVNYAASWGLVPLLVVYGKTLDLKHQIMVFEAAIEAGQLHVLDWLYETYGSFAPWSQRGYTVAKRNGQEEVLRYMIEHHGLKKK